MRLEENQQHRAPTRIGQSAECEPESRSANPSRERVCSSAGRVEKWRGGLDAAYQLPALSSAGASLAAPCFRLHFPLVEPDVRISRIRLSDKESRWGPRDVPIHEAELDQSQLGVQVGIGIACVSHATLLVFAA